MNRLLLFICVVLLQITTHLHAQEPNLVQKNELQTTLGVNETINASNIVSIISLPITDATNMSIEIKAKINSATGRGLDVDLRKRDFKGFRTSLNTQNLQWSAPLSAISVLNFSSTAEQTIRYAVEGETVHIYQNGTYINSKSLTTIYDIDNGVENTNPNIADMTTGPNLIPNIVGTVPTPTQKPNEVGWENNGAGTVPWNLPNTAGVRFTNTLNTNLKDKSGNPYTGTNYFMLLRWESGVTNGSAYYYPVTLEANKTYNLSSLYTYYSNGSSGTFKIAVSKETTGNNLISEFSTSVSNANKTKLYDNNLSFTTTEAGTYYLIFQNDGEGIWLLGNMILKEFGSDARLIIGKNYPEGAADMEISSITFDSSGAYAPILDPNSPKLPITFADQDYTIPKFLNAEVTVSGKSNIHVTAENPFQNSTINLTSNDSWLYLERVRPSQFLDSANGWQDIVKIDGAAFDSENDQVSIYASGCVIIPNGKAASLEALTIYTEENFGGNSQSLAIETYNNNLAAFDNNVKSFKLKKGYAVTLANNADGTGFSKMYIASDEDIEVAALPEGFIALATDKSSFISFIRVFKWEWPSKKGTANLGGKANPSIIYDWAAGGNTENVDTRYVPMRHNLGWDSYETIKARTNVDAVLGYNEPDRSDQSNMTVEAAIEQWPELFKSGLRIGSPAPASVSSGTDWLHKFMELSDLLNYRIDFVAFHAYQDQTTSWWDWNINLASIGGRPVWITEWNNGANWTNTADASKWPNPTGVRLDVHGNPLLDSEGNQVTVALPLTAANAERQKVKLEQILDYFEKNDLVEHHFLYNWVNDARMLELNGEQTPAGEMFGKFNSKVGFKKAKEYNHQWKISPPWVKNKLSSDYTTMEFSWYDHNGETGKSYIVERKTDLDADFVAIKTLTVGTDYQIGKTVTFNDAISYNLATYRVKALSYKDTESAYSREVVIDISDPVAAPILTGKAISTSIIQLEWNKDANALSYDIKRASSQNGTYDVIATKYIYNNPSDTDGTNKFTDENLIASTNYFYKVVGVNNAGSGSESAVLEIVTPSLAIPEAVENLRAASSDEASVLTWNFAYDTNYKITRATSSNGNFTEIANNFSGTRFVDNVNVQNEQTYYYKVQGFNDAGFGPESMEVSANPKMGQHVRFPFDEDNGTTAYDYWGGFHASLKDNASWSEGHVEGGVTLSSVNKSYIQLGNNIVTGLTDFSITTWFKTPSAGNLRLFDFGQGTGKFMVLIPQPRTGDSRFVILAENGSRYDVYMPCVFPLNEWVHVSLTLEGTTLKYYINGELKFTDANCTLNPSSLGTTTQNYLGKSQFAADAYTDHSYDDFRIYNYALTESEIAGIVSQNLGLDTIVPNAADEFSSMVLYPNPAGRNQEINIYSDAFATNEDEIRDILIYNTAGQLVEHKKVQGVASSFSLKAPSVSGTYILECKGSRGSKKFKIIVF